MAKQSYPFPSTFEKENSQDMYPAFAEFSCAYQRRTKYRKNYLDAVTRLSLHHWLYTSDEKGLSCRRAAIVGALIAGEQEIPLEKSVPLTIMWIMNCVSRAVNTLEVIQSLIRRAAEGEYVSSEPAEESRAARGLEFREAIEPLVQQNDLHVFLDVQDPLREQLSTVLTRVVGSFLGRTHVRAVEGIDHPRHRIAEDVARPGDYVLAPLKDRIPIVGRCRNPSQKYYSHTAGYVLESGGPDSLRVLDEISGSVRCKYKGLKVIPDSDVAEDPLKAAKLNRIRALLRAGESAESIIGQLKEPIP
ncbi:MAG: hypothetical protein WCS85_04690 [Candidatus Peribacteraceae bacterium]